MMEYARNAACSIAVAYVEASIANLSARDQDIIKAYPARLSRWFVNKRG